MVGSFTLDYLLFVFIAAFGALQIAAAYGNLQGLLFIRARPLAFGSGLVITVAAFLLFFLTEPRNIPDTEGGLDGNETAGLFTLGAVSALVLTLILSSISNRALGKGGHRCASGLDALRETSYFNALTGTLKDIWKRYRA